MKDFDVLQAFSYQKPGDSQLYHSDGEVLDGNWMGGKRIAFWRADGKVVFNDLGSRKAQQVQGTLRTLLPHFDIARNETMNSREDFLRLVEKQDLEESVGGVTFEIPARSFVVPVDKLGPISRVNNVNDLIDLVMRVGREIQPPSDVDFVLSGDLGLADIRELRDHVSGLG